MSRRVRRPRPFAASATPADAGEPPRPGLAGLAGTGFLGITVPEAAGEAGRPLLDLAVVAEQGGRVLAGPSLVTAARAAVLLCGLPDRLAALADGTRAYAVLDGPAHGSHPALDAVSAQEFLALAGDALVAGAGTVTAGAPLDPTRGLGSVRLESAEVLVADAQQRWERARRIACVVLAAEDLGAAERLVEIGVEYAKLRYPFNRPIGSYQAAKAYASEVFEQVAETLIKVHGGIGFTWDHDAHLYWRRAKVDRLLLGDAAAHRDEVATLALAAAAVPAG